MRAMTLKAFCAFFFAITTTVIANRMEVHYESIVQQWLKRAHKVELYGMSVQELSSKIITHGGWACYSTLIELHLHLNEYTRRREGELVSVVGVHQSTIDEIIHMCFERKNSDKALGETLDLKPKKLFQTSSTSSQFVFNRQHNGLGNQIFQYIFSRLLASSTDRTFQTSLIVPELGESPWKKIEYPPNSVSGWNLFQRLFQAEEMVSSSPITLDGAESSLNRSICLDDSQRCIISDRPYDQHVKKVSLLSQMIGAIYSELCSPKCVFVIGYLQEPLFFVPWRDSILSWLNIEQDKQAWIEKQSPSSSSTIDSIYPALGLDDIVVHVRCCQHSGGGCDWLYLPFEYYDAILSRLTARASDDAKVYIVAPCQTDCEMMDSFRRKYRAVHVTPAKWRNSDKKKMMDTMEDDFRFLLHAPYLVLGKSTFGFWAGWLSTTAKQVHMPVENRHHHFEKIPIVAGDLRFFYHNAGSDEWFGQVQGADMQLRYEERGRWFGPKKLDQNGNFLSKHQN